MYVKDGSQTCAADAGSDAVREDLCRVLAAIDDQDVMRDFLYDLCTPQELSALGERWWIARLLGAGDKPYREIAQITKASTTTVTRVARFLREERHGGYRHVLKMLS